MRRQLLQTDISNRDQNRQSPCIKTRRRYEWLAIMHNQQNWDAPDPNGLPPVPAGIGSNIPDSSTNSNAKCLLFSNSGSCVTSVACAWL